MPFLPPNQQHQSTEGHYRLTWVVTKKLLCWYMLIVYILRCVIYRVCFMWQYLCCIYFVGDLFSKMDIDSDTDAVKEEHLPVEETDNPYGIKITNIWFLYNGMCQWRLVS